MYPVLYDDVDFIVVEKPISISVHSDEGIDGFATKLSLQLNTKLFVVHRLDKVTSGLMIFSKTAEAAAKFGALFANREVKKFYLAISRNKPKKKQGTVKGDMIKSRRSAWKILKTMKNPAITRFHSQLLEENVRLFLLKPETGKTHQIRVMMKSLGAAIYGDLIYGNSNEEKADRCYLHAWQLAFTFNNREFHFKSDVSQGALFLKEGLTLKLEKWNNPQELTWSKG